MYKSPIEITREQIKTQIDNKILFRVTQEVGINIDKDELLKALAYDRQQYEKGYNKAIDDFKIRFFCELNNRVVRPIFSKQIQPKFTIDGIKSIFDEIVEQLKAGEQE